MVRTYKVCPICDQAVFDIKRHAQTKHNSSTLDIKNVKVVQTNTGNTGRIAQGSTRGFSMLEDPPPELMIAYK